MPSLYVTTPGTTIRLSGRTLQVELPAYDGQPASNRILPLVEVERVIITAPTQTTTAALAALAELDIPVALVSWSGRVQGLLRPPSTATAGTRLEQYRRCLDESFCFEMARLLIEAKILNQRRILQRLAANRPINLDEPLAQLDSLVQSTPRLTNRDMLRGIEGTAAAIYYQALDKLFPPEFPLEHRSRRPPHNPTNAVLSYAYTILAAEIEATLWSTGLDPALGFYHTVEDRRASLALDLLEPFRAPVCDALAVDLFTHRMLQAEHFERRPADDPPGHGPTGCFLTLEGRRKFLVQYERRLERQFTYELTGQRTTLRGLIQDQCTQLKKTILTHDPFLPFLMN
ncbi:MAG: CRISPR-associated endonuclease Cas1 [Verrucomicrobiae bacterium]|nr:CRISPR-associated endonuclease Cas1 [Verrucomicrobiae bacterium]MDW8310725.1 CRISPR-associated endonuclease Cas1 [Verrucomicrobiales bacterium]